MSYQVLARKYRPKSFETLVGQEHVVRALTHALEQQRLHHAYLFTGTRGVGKTTLSRILAKSLNCEKGITASPCGECEACVAIDAGRFVDYIEMDAASNRGVDEMAQLLEQAVYAPSNARFKVYMIDEVHMLTNHAFNAMLKTLEEPPEHVKFILATTDPQKIPVTVLSRCLQFNLKQMPPGHIIGHLDNILQQENIAFETPALRLLAQGAHGSMRDALSLTDQAIAYAAGTVSLDAVQGMLGTLDQSYLIRAFDALAAKDGKGLLSVADEMAERSLSYNAALQDMGTLLHQIALAQTVSGALAEDLPQREDIVRLAAAFSPEEVQLFYQIAVHGRNELGLAPDEYAGFSMTLLRMLAFAPATAGVIASAPPVKTAAAPAASAPARPAASAAPVAQAVSAPPAAAPVAAPAPQAAPAAPAPQAAPAVPAAPAGGAKMSPAMAALAAARAASGKGGAGSRPAPVPQAAPAPAPTPVAEVPAPRPVEPVATIPDLPPAPWEDEPVQAVVTKEADSALAASPWEDEPAVAVAEKKTEHVAHSAPVTGETPVAVATAPEQNEPEQIIVRRPVIEPVDMNTPFVLQPVAELNWDGDWPLLAGSLALRGAAQQLAQQSELLRFESHGNGGCFHLRVAVETWCSLGNIEKLSAVLTEHFSKPIRIETTIGGVVHTANARAEKARAKRLKEAEEAVEADPFVQAMMREFDAKIVPGSVRPV
jgi:DNA polymerase-3 subunit gamma/tau